MAGTRWHKIFQNRGDAMTGTMDRPFLESAARCSTCLDLNKEHLRRQWRKFGRLPALDAPYSITLKKVAESVETTSCAGCTLILKASRVIKDEFSLNFQNAVLTYVDKSGQEGLSLTLSMLHPLHTSLGDWEKAQESLDLKTSVHTGPRSDTSKRQWEYKISSPTYEIYNPEYHENSKARDAPRVNESTTAINANKRVTTEEWTSILPRPSRCGDLGGDEAIIWTLSNINQCSGSHRACSKNTTGCALPTRVLDLSENIQNQQSTDIRLHISRGEKEPYLCLSHCWGADKESMPLETTLENLTEFQHGIPWERLTRTFQDAVVFTRKLGYRYLWIDSLCIVQNDREDWMKEAGEMASIYENAVLTLAAASSSNSNGGLFRSSTSSIQLSESFETERICLRRFADPTFFQYQPEGKNSNTRDVSPLLRRAWVFQERMLSRRVLFFTPLELVFECRTSSSTESGYSWVDSATKRAFTVAGDKKNANLELARLWRSLVKDFTQLQLTMYRDTLPAMAGLAKKFQLLRGVDASSYLAGLWKQTFIEDMLWETPRCAVRRHETVNSRIPTWSWARSREPKSYDNHHSLTLLSNLEKAVCELDGQSRSVLTDVDAGYAILYGYLLRAKATSGGLVIDQNPRISHSPLKDYDWFKESPQKVEIGDDLFILPLASTASGQGDAYVHSLILRPCTNNETTFNRIGIFQPSVYHLRGHEHIFEDKDTLLSLYKEDIRYGESLLGRDGLYRGSDERSDKPRYLALKTDKVYKDFKSRAWLLHLCLNGNMTETEHQKFCGLPHLEILKAAMREEEERIRKWANPNSEQDDHVPRRVRVKLV